MEAKMNEIKVKRLLLAGFITLVVFILVEAIVENIFERLVFEHGVNEWYLKLGVQHWGWEENLLNILIALLNTMMLIWLYAALRPMFGVGVKTALITSLFGLVFVTAFAINMANMSPYPWRVAILETGYLLIELPVSIIVGAHVYELDWNKG
jgi:hypothetical protein